MRPISDPASLAQGATLYHSAFGFASVAKNGAHDAQLTWERPGKHLPTKVSHENLGRVYTFCAEDGFFHRAQQDAAGLASTLHAEPGTALVWLLEDLDAPQRLQDVMDWLVGRGLFTPKTFVRWWANAEELVRSDERLSWDGEHMRLRPRAADPIAQVQPGLVDAAELTEEARDGTDDWSTDDLPTADTMELSLTGPVAIGDAKPPAAAVPAIGRALAEVLAHHHERGELAHPNSHSVVLHPDGAVTLDVADALLGPRPRNERPSPHTDVYAAAVVLLEALCGRPLPTGTDPASVIPFLRHRVPDLPASSLAPLLAALHPIASERPDARRWSRLWRAVEDAESGRESAWKENMPVQAAFDSHIGKLKLFRTQTNQDAVHVARHQNQGIYVLCDGISIADAGRGDIASRLAVQAMLRVWEATRDAATPPRRVIDRGLRLANQQICDQALRLAGGSLSGRSPMGTTITIAITDGNRVHLSWLGDSRAYLLGPYGAALLTADDNVSGERFLAWCEQIARSWNPNGHALVRYLGHFDPGWEPAPLPAHHLSFVLRPGERLLLCSDGVTDYCAPHEPGVGVALARRGQLPDAEEAVWQLVRLANQRGGGDNISAILVEADPSDLDDVTVY